MKSVVFFSMTSVFHVTAFAEMREVKLNAAFSITATKPSASPMMKCEYVSQVSLQPHRVAVALNEKSQGVYTGTFEKMLTLDGQTTTLKINVVQDHFKNVVSVELVDSEKVWLAQTFKQVDANWQFAPFGFDVNLEKQDCGHMASFSVSSL